ncbi:MAG: DUF2461 domain-containing protein [Chitinophagaceae bacterium]
MLQPQTIRFLSGLQKNNNKAWFDHNRSSYEAARLDFQHFMELVIKDLEKLDPTIAGTTARECLFRINRDVRFSKDKSPYKGNMGASIKQGGRKSPFAGYYFHIEPGKSFIGGGLWMPDAAALKQVRQEIDYNWDEFSKIIGEKPFKKVYTDLYKDREVSLSTAPKGYEKDNPALVYLKLKSFIAETVVSDEDLSKPSLHKKTIVAFQTLYPFICFINRAISE